VAIAKGSRRVSAGPTNQVISAARDTSPVRARSRRFSRAAAGLLVAALAGCGSTVSGVDATGTAPTGTGDAGLTVPSPGAAGTAPGVTAPGATTGGAGVAAGTGAGSTGTSTGTAPAATGDGAAAPGAVTSGGEGSGVTRAVAPGITDTTIRVGLVYSSDSSAANRAIGAAGAAASYDMRDVYNAYIKYANAHGGFAGRKLEPIYYNLSVSENQDVQAQAACEHWTQDNKVFVMDALRNDILRACAEKAGAISVVGGDGIKSTFDRFPHFLDPNAIRLDRLGPVTVSGLDRAHYFTGKLGLITWDDPNYRFAMEHGTLPALKARGITPALDPIYISVPQQLQELSAMTAATSSAVNKMRTAGVDHVIIADGPAGVWAGGGLTLEFMNNAKSQRWYPRYGQNAYNLPGDSVLPSDQMDKALAILPTDDSAKNDEGWHLNKRRELCYKIQADAGMPVKPSNSGDETIAAHTCDTIFFIQQAVNAIDTVITNDTFVQAVEAFGTSFPSAAVYGTKFGPGLHDGAAMVRTAEYFDSCKCLKYSGPPYYAD
jgi:hypothetical protein